MDAMILAAGLGTRLRPLTDDRPKALIEVGGVPMLERVARRLIAAGATRLIVNAHHFADRIVSFVRERDGFGVETYVSDESGQLLDTGGGLLNAVQFFRRDAPFLLHNSDILCDCDLPALYKSHVRESPLATLAVMRRDSSRYLLFDREHGLCGYGNAATGLQRWTADPVDDAVRFGFCGIHVISPRIFDLIEERGAFSIIELYLRLATNRERILPFEIDGDIWIDIGKPDQLDRARALFPESHHS